MSEASGQRLSEAVSGQRLTLDLIPVIEPFNGSIQTFSSTDEFNLYYAKNKAEVDSLNTRKLNERYVINGYKLTRIKGKLTLKKESHKQSLRSQFESLAAELDEITRTVRNQDVSIMKLKETVTALIKHVNELVEPV